MSHPLGLWLLGFLSGIPVGIALTRWGLPFLMAVTAG